MTIQDHSKLDDLKYPTGDFYHNNFGKKNPLRILLLEDLASDAELEMYYIGEIDTPHVIKHVESKTEFIYELDTFCPHLVISDYQLPQYTGIDALLHVKNKSSYTPFIMCTGRINEETAVDCIKLGADDYVLKDDMIRLPSAIQHILEATKNKIQKDKLNADLLKSEENLRAIIQNSPSNIYTINKDGIVLYNTNSRETLAVDVGESIYDHVHPKNHANIKKHIDLSFRLKMDIEFEIEGNLSAPKYNYYQVKMGPILKNGEVKELVFIPNLITEIKLAQIELKEMNLRLNLLNNHLEHVRDKEKQKIAMEIHDQLGQELIGNKLGLYWFQQNLNGDLNEKKELFSNKLKDLVNLSTRIITTTRRIAHELRPVVLDDIGLLAALEWHIENYNKFRTTNCSLVLDCGEYEFSKNIATAIYRIVQESLTNIDKHASATEVKVSLTSKDGQIELIISDNGVGLNVNEALNSKSMGLFSMRERIKAWNGTFDLISEGKGTTIHINITDNK